MGEGVTVDKGRLENALLATSVALALTSCGSESPSDNLLDLQQIEVACIEVPGLPEMTEKVCDDLTRRVEQSAAKLGELTGGAIEIPQEVHGQILSGKVEIENAQEIRCTNLDAPTEEQQKKLKIMVSDLTNFALEQVSVDSQTGLIVATNGSLGLCRPETPPILTERCTDKSKEAFLGGQALHRELQGWPVAFVFASEPKRDSSLIRHELLHLQGLGHVYGFCNRNGEWIPTRIGSEQSELDLDIHADASIMSYTYIGEPYIASPHLEQLGLIGKDRVIIPEASGRFTLSDMDQSGPAALQLALTSTKIKNMIAPEIAKASKAAKTNLSVNDYVLRISKMEGSAAVTIHATLPAEKLNEDTPIFQVEDLSVKELAEPGGLGGQLDIVDGPKITMISGNEDVVTIDLQLAGAR